MRILFYFQNRLLDPYYRKSAQLVITLTEVQFYTMANGLNVNLEQIECKCNPVHLFILKFYIILCTYRLITPFLKIQLQKLLHSEFNKTERFDGVCGKF